MTNLVAQARAEADLLDHDGEPLRATLMRELADEIERLQRYVEALEFVADSHGLQAAQAMVRAADEPTA